MSGCKIDSDCCQQFVRLREYLKKNGYPKIDADLEEAFENIRKDVRANQCAVMPGFSDILQGLFLHKYRQKDKAHREGASGGWRIIALFDPSNSTLYPIVIYPKKELEDADDATITAGVREMMKILGKS